MCFIMNFCENHFPRMKNDKMSFSLLEIIKHENQLKWNDRNDKIWSICLYLNKVFQIEMNKYKSFDKRFYETLKCLSNFCVEIKKLILFSIFIVFEQFRQRVNNACVKSYEMFIKVCEFQKHLKFFQYFWFKSNFNEFYAILIHNNIIVIDNIF